MKFRSHANTLVIALLTLCSVSIFGQSPKVSVESIGMTVSDMDRSVAFYSALTFQKVSDVEVLGEHIDNFSLTFVAPLGAHNHSSIAFFQVCRTPKRAFGNTHLLLKREPKKLKMKRAAADRRGRVYGQ